MDKYLIGKQAISQIRRETRMRVYSVKHTCRDLTRSKTSSKEMTWCFSTTGMTTLREVKSYLLHCSTIWWSCRQRRTTRQLEVKVRMTRNGWMCPNMSNHQFILTQRILSAMTEMHKDWIMLFSLEHSMSASSSKVSLWKCWNWYASR